MAPRPPVKGRTARRGWAAWMAALGGAGFLPWVPGTWGSLVALLPLAWVPAPAFLWVAGAGTVAASLASVLLARRLDLVDKARAGDPGWFVMDEMAGVWLAALAAHSPSPLRLLVVFVLFRAFDMLKPPPLRRLEHAGGGAGIVLDDLGAGMYAGASAMIFFALVPLD